MHFFWDDKWTSISETTPIFSDFAVTGCACLLVTSWIQMRVAEVVWSAGNNFLLEMFTAAAIMLRFLMNKFAGIFV